MKQAGKAVVHKWNEELLVATLAALLAIAGCGDGVTEDSPVALLSDAAFSGQITMVVSEPEGDGDINRTYEYDLNGAVARLNGVQRSNNSGVELDQFATGFVGCHGSPKLKSPNGEFTAHCEGPFPGLPRDHQVDFIVIEDKNGKQVFKRGVWHRFRIIGYAWSPDSRSIGVAQAYCGMGWRPLDLLGALSGHPSSVCDFDVMPFSIDGKASMRLPPVRVGARNGTGIIAGWK